ncbi:DUF1801 domain-containing protein [Chryseolinea sp. T2]|uniref:DUF1801 domain-containing protein n=1 Tax=Chryseolinea sp. T2 TaxID=3129255 RepID=UPI0030788D68
MMREISEYYHKQPEPIRSCLLGMRDIILKHDSEIVEAWKYRMPMFMYKGKMFCYLWIRRNEPVPYLGIVNGKLVNDPDLIQEKRARMKILLIDPGRDIPVRKIRRILTAAMGI